jgi:hypothetical protein
LPPILKPKIVIYEFPSLSPGEMMNKRLIFWPEPFVLECSAKPIGILRRLKLAWSCLFREDVRGLCLQAPDWVREKGK